MRQSIGYAYRQSSDTVRLFVKWTRGTLETFWQQWPGHRSPEICLSLTIKYESAVKDRVGGLTFSYNLCFRDAFTGLEPGYKFFNGILRHEVDEEIELLIESKAIS